MVEKSKEAIFIGIDIGTQGIRIMAVTDDGSIAASDSHTFSLMSELNIREEQSPELWWNYTLRSLKKVSEVLKTLGVLNQVAAISVTSTSGTVIPLDRNCQPLHHALMYSDTRSTKEALLCREASRRAGGEDYTPFEPSYGLPKIVWFSKQFPEKAEQVHLWCHPTDFILGKLSNQWGCTDYTNALKTGFNLVTEKWPDYLQQELNLPSSWFPKVVPSGTVLGTLSVEISELSHLPETIKVVAGLTDGCASQMASGSLKPGEWNTTIGTTMVIKGVTRNRIMDPLGRLYNHKHPKGYWMPGGASNTGADWISTDFEHDDLNHLNQWAERFIPTGTISYPLKQHGERFPFISQAARGFDAPNLSREQLYASRMEGLAYLERLAYEMIEELSSEKVQEVYTAGGGSNSDVWLAIRSNVLNKPIYRMEHNEGAIGAAIVAASGTYFSDIESAGRHMLKLSKVVEPGAWVEQYDEGYYLFIEALKSRGFLA